MVRQHPYLDGNYSPINVVHPLTKCRYSGVIPSELAGGEYVRNGGNPVSNEALGRDAHWFDGDGMLSGVLFRKLSDGSIEPQFVNQFILTDVYLSAATTPIHFPILPSIATLVNPLSSILTIIVKILRTLLLVLLSHLPGSAHAVKKLSVVNTAIIFHDGRALATCESGPPMRILLPGLETVGWFDGSKAEGEIAEEVISRDRFGGDGPWSFMKDWTVAHPRLDPITNELLLFHSTFFSPFIHYSILPDKHYSSDAYTPKLVNVPVPGISEAKMMHDFGVSLGHTVIMSLPLSLDPRNLAKSLPVVSYDPNGRSRFGVFPRWNPEAVRYFETDACCIFHAANAWDETTTSQITKAVETKAVNLLVCRLTSATLVYSTGNMAAPIPVATSKLPYNAEDEQCRLYYYRFLLSNSKNTITHQFALCTIPFEFPTIRDSVSMSSARYVYGCSVEGTTFGASLGRAAKIDSLVKVDALTLIDRAEISFPTPITGYVDNRSATEILQSKDPGDPIKIFKLPPGHYGQEARFVPRRNGVSEDDGWIIFYVFNEAQLDENGVAGPDAKSELWVVDAKGMKEVICKVIIPQRVPYGLHGNWFSEEVILRQRPVETFRQVPAAMEKSRVIPGTLWMGAWMQLRRWAFNMLR